MIKQQILNGPLSNTIFNFLEEEQVSVLIGVCVKCDIGKGNTIFD